MSRNALDPLAPSVKSITVLALIGIALIIGVLVLTRGSDTQGGTSLTGGTSSVGVYPIGGLKTGISVGFTRRDQVVQALGPPNLQVEWESGTIPFEWSVAQMYRYDTLRLRVVFADRKLSVERLFSEGERSRVQLVHTEDERVRLRGIGIGDPLTSVREKSGEGRWIAEAIGNCWWLEYRKKHIRFAFARDQKEPRFPRRLAQPEVVEAMEVFTPVTVVDFPPFVDDEWRVTEEEGQLSAGGAQVGDDLETVYQRCGRKGTWSIAGVSCWKYQVTVDGKTWLFFFRRDMSVPEQPMTLMSPQIAVGLETSN